MLALSPRHRSTPPTPKPSTKAKALLPIPTPSCLPIPTVPFYPFYPSTHRNPSLSRALSSYPRDHEHPRQHTTRPQLAVELVDHGASELTYRPIVADRLGLSPAERRYLSHLAVRHRAPERDRQRRLRHRVPRRLSTPYAGRHQGARPGRRQSRQAAQGARDPTVRLELPPLYCPLPHHSMSSRDHGLAMYRPCVSVGICGTRTCVSSSAPSSTTSRARSTGRSCLVQRPIPHTLTYASLPSLTTRSCDGGWL